jgi:3-dehydroquinate synthase
MMSIMNPNKQLIFLSMLTLKLPTYNVYVGDDAWQTLQHIVQAKKYSKIFVLTDENTQLHCLPIVLKETGWIGVNVLSIPSGEVHKTLETCSQIWSQLLEHGTDRKALLVNLGGGVIGDMGGFCASTFKRGFDFIQLPTTLLSQVDASIGGKLGIDFQGVKNSIGVFQNPMAVFVFPAFLETLSQREVRSGFAEIIKHGLIADAKQWAAFQKIKDLKKVAWQKLIVPSLRIKQRIVKADPFEQNVRKALNFGHTIGHAIESYALETETPLLHGEAIAIGLITECYLSHKILGLPKEDLENITRFILTVYDNYFFSKEIFPVLLATMQQDKKNEHGNINFTLIDRIGNFQYNQQCSEALILESLEYYLAFCGNAPLPSV